jgi:predicted PhzF superfamily epimerase YddE/YHI9
LFVVDAFTSQAFRGNPAGVVFVEKFPGDEWMQSVAAELGFAETAFVTPVSQGVRGLRWFTPAYEVDLCGHATLATAHVLGGDNVFQTRSGKLTTSAGQDGWVHMDFPLDKPISVDADLSRELPGVTHVAVARGVSDFLVQVASADEVRAVVPDLRAVADLPARGVIVTATEGDEVVSRCFYPGAGVPEDPVTGSAHCTLAGWWAPKLGREDFVAHQLSPRGGTIKVVVRGERVGLAGQAVTVVSGRLEV